VGVETTTEGIPVQGMLDPEILRVMMRNRGVTRAVIDRSLPEIQRAAERYYLRVCPELHQCHTPAAAQTLERLRRRHMLLALVTGNLTRIGWRKLERAGLSRYFAFGAFGEMRKTRGGLVKMAIEEARRLHQVPREAPVVLVGDAPSDILAARQNRIRSISVRTGITPVEQLRELEPDYLLRNLRDLRLSMIEDKGARAMV
jgi:phosphoglycolate phosphatase-like HAD superfamily hydrolase